MKSNHKNFVHLVGLYTYITLILHVATPTKDGSSRIDLTKVSLSN